MLANGAGVIQNDGRFFPVGGELVTECAELAYDEFGIEFVHLAAKGLEEDGLGWRAMRLFNSWLNHVADFRR